MTIAITTPTGNVGRRVMQQLAAADEQVKVLARDPAKLGDPGAHVAVVHGDLADPAALDRLLAGAEALFYVIPPHFTVEDWRGWQRQLGHAAAEAVRRHGTPRVVMLSSIGAQRPDLGPVSGLGEVEAMLGATGAAVTALRACYFMENALAQLQPITTQGLLFGAFAPDDALAMVATRDIADVATAVLRDRRWAGTRVQGIHGPADRTHADLARVIGDALERPVQYVQVPPDAVGASMAAMGASPSVAQGYTEMVRGFAAGGFQAEPRTAETTTPTPLETWTRETLVPAVRAMGMP